MLKLSDEIKVCRATLLAVAPVLPRRDSLHQEVKDAQAAQERGYYLPDEDERLRYLIAQYLDVRTALLGVVSRMEPWLDKGSMISRQERLQVFAIGFTTACFLIRCAQYMIEMADGKKVVTRKLNEAEPRFGIPRKVFTKIYRSQSSVRRMWKFHEAWRFYEANRDEVLALRAEPEFTEVIELLEGEEPFMETRRRNYWKKRIRYRLHSIRRRHRSTLEQSMFHLLEFGGRTVAELRDPTAGRRSDKRAAGAVSDAVAQILEPSDIIITRHRDALSNLFLPGYWPHGALYVGELGGPDGDVMEARKDGVLLRQISETLAVDCFLVLRANVTLADREEVARRSLTHRGKLFDFAFDFTQAHRLACTALIYRSWHNQAGVTFDLVEQSGRLCLPAEQLIDQALSSGKFTLVAYFGPECDDLKLSNNALNSFKADRAKLRATREGQKDKG